MEQKEPYLVDNRQRKHLEKPIYSVDMGKDVFGLEVKGPEGNVFTVEEQLVFSEYYLQLNLKVDNNLRMFGLNERFAKFEVEKGNNYVHWSYD